jgi:acyl-CoA thioesterase
MADETVSARIGRFAARDRLMRLLGIEYVGGGPGRAAVSLAVRDDHLNFNGTCHGGVTFALADAAFGLASNSHGVVAAAIDAHITYQVAVKSGDKLTATAAEASRSRKLGVYRIDVAREDGALVSTFTGTVYVTDRPNES